ncbi:MAG TPA: hypothetical protein VES42_05805 [Pilimelia sp.]|nr:hypothetical protein [Pilimelia sp.]
MFGSGKSRRAQAAQRIAEEAWEQVVAAVESAGDVAKTAGRRTSTVASTVAEDAGSRASAAADEARYRAAAALDALAGRRPTTPWAWLAGATVAGLVIGWLAAASTRRAMNLAEQPAVEPAPDTQPLDPSVSPEF